MRQTESVREKQIDRQRDRERATGRRRGWAGDGDQKKESNGRLTVFALALLDERFVFDVLVAGFAVEPGPVCVCVCGGFFFVCFIFISVEIAENGRNCKEKGKKKKKNVVESTLNDRLLSAVDQTRFKFI